MAISQKVRALMKLKGKTNIDVAGYLGISAQAYSNKLHRDSFSAADLIKIATFLNCDLAFIVDDVQRIVLDKSDLMKNNKEPDA